jgi:3D (Asp-Asp-Asp) domain-containing protein
MRPRYAAIILLIAVFASLTGCARFKPPPGVDPVTVTMEVTAYCDCGKCTNWKRNWLFRPVIASGPNKGERKKVGITASGTKARPGTIAADTAHYPFGTIMYVPGYGYGRVEDRGRAIKGNRLDLFYKKHKDALEWGRQTVRVKVWLPHRR